MLYVAKSILFLLEIQMNGRHYSTANSVFVLSERRTSSYVNTYQHYSCHVIPYYAFYLEKRQYVIIDRFTCIYDNTITNSFSNTQFLHTSWIQNICLMYCEQETQLINQLTFIRYTWYILVIERNCTYVRD